VATNDLAESLHLDRRTWEQHGVLPGEERLGPYFDRLDLNTLDDADLVFLWIGWAFVTTGAASHDESGLDREILPGEVTDHVSAVAVQV
jgi:hypothetical protein